MYDYFDIYMNYGEEKNTIFAHPEYAVQNQLTIKTNTFSESLYFVLFNYLMTKWWKCSINTGWSRKVNMFLLEFMLCYTLYNFSATLNMGPNCA